MSVKIIKTKNGVAIICEPLTQEERLAYEKSKEEYKQECLKDTEKQIYKKPLGITQVQGIRCGVCPTCNSVLMYGDIICDECFQKIKWYD